MCIRKDLVYAMSNKKKFNTEIGEICFILSFFIDNLFFNAIIFLYYFFRKDFCYD